MNNTFSFKRFRLLIQEIFSEKIIFLFGIVLGAFLVHLLVGLLLNFPTSYLFLRPVIIAFSFIIPSVILVIVLAKKYYKTSIGIRNLMMPVSNLERWFSVVFILIFFLLIHQVTFRIADTVLINAITAYLENSNIQLPEVERKLTELVHYPFLGSFSYLLIALPLLMGSWLLAISTYFNKNKTVLSIFSALCLIATLFLLNSALTFLFFDFIPDFFSARPFDSVTVQVGSAESGVRNSIFVRHSSSNNIFQYCLFPIVSLFLLTIYYFRLKETEI